MYRCGFNLNSADQKLDTSPEKRLQIGGLRVDGRKERREKLNAQKQLKSLSEIRNELAPGLYASPENKGPSTYNPAGGEKPPSAVD